jgi:hypothetical protein
MELATAVKIFAAKFETQMDTELHEELKAAKSGDEIALATARGALQALRALYPCIQAIHQVLYPTPEERLNFILEPLEESKLEDVRKQIRTLKANEQYRVIGLLTQRALDFWEAENGGNEE